MAFENIILEILQFCLDHAMHQLIYRHQLVYV